MTCEECLKTVNTVLPWDVPRAVVAAVTGHVMTCQACATTVRGRRDRERAALEEELGPEGLARFHADVAEVTTRYVRTAMRDPEVVASLPKTEDILPQFKTPDPNP